MDHVRVGALRVRLTRPKRSTSWWVMSGRASLQACAFARSALSCSGGIDSVAAQPARRLARLSTIARRRGDVGFSAPRGVIASSRAAGVSVLASLASATGGARGVMPLGPVSTVPKGRGAAPDVCTLEEMTLDVAELLAHWGYAAIFAAVILGNVGFPVPEETILVLGGYLAQRGTLRLDLVLGIGVVSAVVGDGIGYWLGRHYGRQGHRALRPVGVHDPAPAREGVPLRDPLRRVGRVLRAVRGRTGFLAGPLAGATGLRPLAFATGNILGALLFVPVVVGMGYVLGRAFGDDIERLVDRVEHLALGVAVVLTLSVVIVRFFRARRAAG